MIAAAVLFRFLPMSASLILLVESNSNACLLSQAVFSVRMQHFEGYDPEGFSMWWCDYKYPEENTVNFIVMNKVRSCCKARIAQLFRQHMCTILRLPFDPPLHYPAVYDLQALSAVRMVPSPFSKALCRTVSDRRRHQPLMP